MKRMMKKMTACFMAFAMLLALSVNAFAAATGTISGSDAIDIFGVVSVQVTSTDADLNGVKVTIASGTSDYTVTTDNASYTGELSADRKTVTIKKGATEAATITFTISDSNNDVVNAALNEISAGNGNQNKTFDITLSGIAGGGNNAPAEQTSITGSVTIDNSAAVKEATGLTAATLDTSDLGLNGATVTLKVVADGAGTKSWDVEISDTDYDVAMDGVAAINITKDSAAAGTITLTGLGTANTCEVNDTAVLTLTVVEGVTPAGNTSGTDGVTTLTSAGTIGSSGGVGKIEGGDPNKVVNVILPTAADGFYDMILDPNDLLADTNYAKYTAGTVNFSGSDGRLFFNQGSSDGKVQFGNDSMALDVINRGQENVSVQLTLDVDKGKSTALQFVADSALNSTDAAAMYLGLVTIPSAGAKDAAYKAKTTTGVASTAAVVNATSSGTVSVTQEIPSVTTLFKRQYANGAYSYVENGTYENNDFNRTNFYLTGKINNNKAWKDVGRTDISLTMTWKVTPVINETPAAPTASVETKATAIAGNVVLTYNLGGGNLKATAIKSVTYGDANTEITPTNDASAKTLTFSATRPIYNAGKVTVTFNDEAETAIEVAIV